jgi:hypothetical protein
LALCFGVLVATTGCVETESFVRSFHHEAAPAPCQLVATWYPEVVFTPDPAHGGMPGPGLAGRLYLFGPEVGAPLIGDGSLVVDLFDDSSCAKTQAGTPMPLEEWRFDRDTLKRLERPDAVGAGYTLFLPWGTYKPETSHVHVRLQYQPAKGTPLYNESPTISLRKSGDTVAWQTTDIPAKQSQEQAGMPAPTRASGMVGNQPAINPLTQRMAPGQTTANGAGQATALLASGTQGSGR